MRDEKRPVAALLWYGAGLLPLTGVSLFWATTGGQQLMLQRIFLFVLGAALGGCLLLLAGERLRPQGAALANVAGGGEGASEIANPRGGDVAIEGNRSGGIGGDAGQSGLWPGGRGGDVVIKGDDAFGRGGSGGNSPTADGRGGRRTKSPAELQNMPTEFWRYGYGGSAANHPEYERRLKLLTQIRQEYLQAFPDDTKFIEAGIDAVPINWVNKRLEEIGETWRVDLTDGGYVLPPLPKEK